MSKNFNLRPEQPCRIIGEVGVNHNNNPELLFRLIDAGIEAGVDIIKLQRFKASAEISSYAPKAKYQIKGETSYESQLEMAQKLELSDELICRAYDYCKRRQIGFLCAAFDHDSVDFIADRLGCKTIKVPSPELNNKPLLEHIAKKFPAILVSTGASYLRECMQTVDWLHTLGAQELILMHCVSEYPAPISEANLRAIQTLNRASGLPIGYSDHTEGIVAPIVAASLGAVVIEKHFTLDKNLPGPDHKASADISELTAMVKAIKDACSSFGDGIKQPALSERLNRTVIRKSVVCIEEFLPEGTVLEKSMLGIKRPEVSGAVLPFDVEKIIGLKLIKQKIYDQPILWSDFR